MREIKFRAWDKKEKKMQRVDRIYFYSTHLEVYTSESLEQPYKNTSIVFMQYTGLKDKNGTEIFEGDLIRAGQMIYQIAWYGMDGRLMPFTTEPINSNQYMASSGVPIRNWNWLDGGEGIYYHDIKKSVNIEVIGSIYENPELIRNS